MVAGFDLAGIGRMPDDEQQPTSEDELRAFVARKVGELHADIAKLTAILSLWAQPQVVQRYRLLTYGILVWLALLTVVLIGHTLFSAGLFGR